MRIVPVTTQKNPNLNQNRSKINFKAARLNVSEKSIEGALRNAQNMPFYQKYWEVGTLSQEELMKKAQKIFRKLQNVCKKYENDDFIELEIRHHELSRAVERGKIKERLEHEELLSLDDVHPEYEDLLGEPIDPHIQDFFMPRIDYSIYPGKSANRHFLAGGNPDIYSLEGFEKDIDEIITGFKTNKTAHK